MAKNAGRVKIFESTKNVHAFETEVNNWIIEFLGWKHIITSIAQSTYKEPSFWWWKSKVVTVITIHYYEIE
jgi:hypothetical protein